MDYIPNWCLQIRDINPEKFRNVRATVKVLDYTRDGKHPWTRGQLDYLRDDPDNKMLCLLNIFEAQPDRWYWEDSWLFSKHRPDFILQRNPQISSNYFVDFTGHRWQVLMLRTIDLIFESGFDGVILTGIPDCGVGYEFLTEMRVAVQMSRMSCYGWDGLHLLDDEDTLHRFDGWFTDDLMYGQNFDALENDFDYYAKSCTRLDRMIAENKPVYVLEILTNQGQAVLTSNKHRRRTYIPYVHQRRAFNTLAAPIKIKRLLNDRVPNLYP